MKEIQLTLDVIKQNVNALAAVAQRDQLLSSQSNPEKSKKLRSYIYQVSKMIQKSIAEEMNKLEP